MKEALELRGIGKAGLGVFAGNGFVEGERILTYEGPILTFDEIADGSYEDEHCVQVGESTYIGPSGRYDDFVNCSCEPNSGLKVVNGEIVLVAIRNIGEGEEITFDYSTYMDENYWEMECRCGALNCRGRIRDFKYLPEEIQKRYLELGIVPEFIVRKICRHTPGVG